MMVLPNPRLLKSLRIQLKYSRTKLALELNINVNAIAKAERGESIAARPYMYLRKWIDETIA
jgi:transcriptional regulator with XRE-family HTH domain